MHLWRAQSSYVGTFPRKPAFPPGEKRENLRRIEQYSGHARRRSMLLALNSPAALLLPYALPPPSYPICREAGQEGRNRTESSIFCGSMRGHLGTSVLAAAAVLLSTSMPGVKAADCCTGTSAQGCISDATFWAHPDPCSDGSITRGCDICFNMGIFGDICTRTGTEYMCYTGCGCTQCT